MKESLVLLSLSRVFSSCLDSYSFFLGTTRELIDETKDSSGRKPFLHTEKEREWLCDKKEDLSLQDRSVSGQINRFPPKKRLTRGRYWNSNAIASTDLRRDRIPLRKTF